MKGNKVKKIRRNLITGGAGFIGSHLADELIRSQEAVTVIDNLSTGSMDNVIHLKENKNFKLYIDTIMNERLMRRLIDRTDRVYHMAAAVGVKYIINNPLESIETNVKGTEIVLELANKLGKKKVLVASTSEIYGKDRANHKVFKEDDDRVLGSTSISRWSYSCTKALDEFLALAYWRERKLPVVIVRLFNTCGPRQTGTYGMVIPRFVKQALLNQPMTIFGDGRQTRCFTYITDVVDALIRLMNHPKAVGEAFNIGNPIPTTIRELAKIIKKKTNSRSKIVFIPYKRAYEEGFEDMRHRESNIGKLNKLIGFRPKVDLNETLDRIIEYFEK
ncbi:GDP-mannose 4,6-dehydratase [Candidatus Omnitrophota bacterium]